MARETARVTGTSLAAKGENFKPCDACDRTNRVGQPDACRVCNGSGACRVKRPSPPRISTKVIEECGEVIRAHGFIRSHGLDAWMLMNGEPSEILFEAMDVIDREIGVLQLRAQLKEVKAARDGK